MPRTECTVLVAENPDDAEQPKTYTPVQYRFPAVRCSSTRI
ncbi:MAG: hypothetical protein WDN04_24265 [Rhodospirillales bacterium]